VDVSTYVLERVLPAHRTTVATLLAALKREEGRRYALAALNDLLSNLTPIQFQDAVDDIELEGLSPLLRNYVTAMVEQAASQKRVAPPRWVRDVEPLDEPYFAVPFPSLRAHLLRTAPLAFKRRNIFIDSAVGDRV
jgi:hypothetical protein